MTTPETYHYIAYDTKTGMFTCSICGEMNSLAACGTLQDEESKQ